MGHSTIVPKHSQIYGPAPKNGIYGDKELGKMMDEFNSYIPKLKGLSPELKDADLKLRDGENWIYIKNKPGDLLRRQSNNFSDASKPKDPWNKAILGQAAYTVEALYHMQVSIQRLDRYSNTYPNKDVKIRNNSVKYNTAKVKENLNELRNMLGKSLKK